jgi:hypothetical protein
VFTLNFVKDRITRPEPQVETETEKEENVKNYFCDICQKQLNGPQPFIAQRAHGQWFSLASPTTKTGRHDIAEILLKVVLNTINQINRIN